MKIIPISVELLDIPTEPIYAYRRIEEAGRTCYKSENKNNDVKLTESFIRGLIKSGHTSVLEHLNISFRIVCDRGTSHQLVRHRHIAVSQQSTRYVSSESGIEVIKPLSLCEGTPGYDIWVDSIKSSEKGYANLMKCDMVDKDLARSVLPLCTKTELVITTNAREWRQIIKQRSSPHAHENIRLVANMLLAELCKYYPVVFEDLKKGD